MDEIWWLDIVRGGVTLSVLAYIWSDNKSRVEKQADDLRDEIEKKADYSAYMDMRASLVRDIERIENRQNKEIDGLRAEMNGMADRLTRHFDSRFDQILRILGERNK